MKKLSNLMCTLAVLSILTGLCNSASMGINSGDTPLERITIVNDSIPPDNTGMRELTSIQLAKEMSPGWNVGNSLEAIGGETAWGNPKITQVLIDQIKAAGFNTVRIPVAWSNNMDTSTFKINPQLLGRVDEVVNYVLQNDMYAIINIHWDGGWMQPTYARQDYVNRRLAAIWQQVAVYFRDYDDHLLFAGSNEVMVDGDYSAPKKEYYTVQNGFNQIFISTVRSTGGCNTYRHLVIQGFNTNINNAVNYLAIPFDVTKDRMMIEVHYYDPYNFTINASSNLYQWGKDAPKSETWANEVWADAQFDKMKKTFIDKGYAVILGEYGVLARLNLGDQLNAEFAAYRKYYMEYVTRSMFLHGLVPIVWDNGGTGNHGMGLFNRSTGAQAYPDIIEAIMEAVDTTGLNTGLNEHQINQNPDNYYLHQNYPNPFNPTTTIVFNIPIESYVSLDIYDCMGRVVAPILSGEMKAGTYSRKFDGTGFSSGIYFYRLKAGSFSQTRKLIILQ